MLSAYNICCIYWNALQTNFAMEAKITNTMSLDQTALGAVWSWVILFAIKATKVLKQNTEQTNSRESNNAFKFLLLIFLI